MIKFTHIFITYTSTRRSDQLPIYVSTSHCLQDIEAEYFLGICYEKGWGVEENTCKAASMYAQAASDGHDGAMYNLAVFHEHGLGGENYNLQLIYRIEIHILCIAT